MRSVRLPEVKTKSWPWRLETSRSSSREESDSGEEDDQKDNDETWLVAQASSEPGGSRSRIYKVCFDVESMKKRFKDFVFLDTQLKNVPVPLDHFPVNALTNRVTLERQSKPQLIPSPPHLSEDQHKTQTDPSPRPSPTTDIPDSIPEGFGRNHGDQAKEIKHLKSQIKKLKKKAKHVITHHKAWMKSGRKPAKAEPTVHKDLAFDELDDDTMDNNERLRRLNIQNKEKLKEKEKGVELKDVEEIERPRPTSTRSLLTLRPLPKIDPKAKGKEKIEEEDESNTESEEITEAEKKFKQLANDEEVAKKVQEEWEAEEEKKRLAEEEATKAELSNEYDFIQARLNADKILAKKLQEEEREMYTIEQRAKFFHDTIAHVGGKKHSNLKTKSFEEIQVLYENIKRSDDSFIAIGSAKDEKVIKEMNEQAADASKKRVKKDDSVKGEIKEEERIRKRKLGTRKKMKSKKRKFTSKDDEELRLCLTIVSDEDKEVDYEILDKKYPIIEWISEYLTTKPQYDETEELEDD
ncbi:hypothetical protein Tco_0916390, partial [Tanacetum coccineum]